MPLRLLEEVETFAPIRVQKRETFGIRPPLRSARYQDNHAETPAAHDRKEMEHSQRAHRKEAEPVEARATERRWRTTFEV
jgi:hypothetical protein